MARGVWVGRDYFIRIIFHFPIRSDNNIVSLSALPVLALLPFAISCTGACVYNLHFLRNQHPLSRQANMTVHTSFYMHPGRPLASPLPHHSRRGGQTTHSGTTKYIRPCWVSCLLCISHDAAPGRCRRSPALRALELLPAIDGAQGCTYMLSKELRPPR